MRLIFVHRFINTGGEYATVWMEKNISETKKIIYLTVDYTYDKKGGKSKAIDIIEKAIKLNLDDIKTNHENWWHEFYTKSFISIPDKRIETFYWIQMYKLASATREDTVPIDLMGPWTDSTPWAAVWWNLNIQLTYFPIYTSNHLELGKPFCKMLDKNIDNLMKNVPEVYQHDSAGISTVSDYNCVGKIQSVNGFCNLTWACHNYWLQYRYCMDDVMLKEKLYPLLKLAINMYIHLMYKGDDGKYHLPEGSSPEYPERSVDCNSDLQSFRWGCITLIYICERLKKDDALKCLNKLLDQKDYPIASNTLYKEAGPVIETPLSAAKSLQDMILQSWGNKIRIFKGVPSTWEDVVFDDLLAEGAFKVSAVMKNGEIIYIRIHSLAGERCCLKADLIGEYNAEKSNGEKYTVQDIDEMKVDIKKGETIVFYKKGQDINDMIKPVSNQYGRSNYYGLNK